MDIVLVGTDLVGPGPFVEVGGGGELVEAAVPEDGAWEVVSMLGSGRRRDGGDYLRTRHRQARLGLQLCPAS